MSILYALPSLFSVLFHLGALIFLATRPSDGSRAKMYAILGFAVLILSSAGGWGIQIIMTRMIDASSIAYSFGLFSLFHSLLYFVGLSFIIAAVVVGRRPAIPNAFADGAGTGNRTYEPSDNPYVPPAHG